MSTLKKAPRTLADLTPDPTNRRRHTSRNLAMIETALKDVGAARSIVIDEDGQILAGNATVRAAVGVGLAKVKTVDVDGQTVVAVRRQGLTDAQKRALALYDNRAAELAEWDTDQLQADLAAGEDLSAFFELEELVGLVGEQPKEGHTDPDVVPEPRATDITPGDVFVLGDHRLLCGDSLNKSDIVLLGEGPFYGMHDPPYGISVVGVDGSIGGEKPYGKIGSDAAVKSNVYAPVTGDDRPFDPRSLLSVCPESILWGANYYADRLKPQKAWIVWDKKGRENWRDRFSDCELAWTPFKAVTRIYRHTWMGMVQQGERETRVHPTQKPVALFERIMRDYFSGDQRVVLDLYAGSGTTLLACERIGRCCHAMELEPQYCQVIIDRWEAFTGEKARKDGEASRS